MQSACVRARVCSERGFRNAYKRDLALHIMCVDQPLKTPLAHAPNPVFQPQQARIAICGQAPGNLADKSGQPFDDPSGDRLRDWLGVTRDQFYNSDNFAMIPMGFCFPGYNAKGSDLPAHRMPHYLA